MLPPEMQFDNALIIDDELDICILLKEYLTRKGGKVDYSTSLKEGMEKFNLSMPDLLILDHNLPDGHGIDTIKKFREINGAIHVIVISAMSNLRSKAFENGADYFIEKPISFSKLNDILMS